MKVIFESVPEDKELAAKVECHFAWMKDHPVNHDFYRKMQSSSQEFFSANNPVFIKMRTVRQVTGFTCMVQNSAVYIYPQLLPVA